MKVAYIAGPYRDPRGAHYIKENIRRAEAVGLKYAKKGYAVIIPHKNTAFLDGALPDEFWLKMTLALLARCDTIVMMKGWETSLGAVREYNFATENGIEIIHHYRGH